MQKVSASASRSLPSRDPRRYSYRQDDSSGGGADGHTPLPAFCNCRLPVRPDDWSDAAWQKYITAMARLPCKPCGWLGGGFKARSGTPVTASSSRPKNMTNTNEKQGLKKVAAAAAAAASTSSSVVVVLEDHTNMEEKAEERQDEEEETTVVVVGEKGEGSNKPAGNKSMPPRPQQQQQKKKPAIILDNVFAACAPSADAGVTETGGG